MGIGKSSHQKDESEEKEGSRRMSHDHVTGEEVVYIARALKANFPILSLLLYLLLQHQSQVREFPPFSFSPSLTNVWQEHFLPSVCLSALIPPPSPLLPLSHFNLFRTSEINSGPIVYNAPLRLIGLLPHLFINPTTSLSPL